MVMQAIVDAADEGIRLDRWFKRHHPGVPHAMLSKWLRKGAVRLDGKKVEASARLSAGQAVAFPQEAPALAPMKAAAKPPSREAMQARDWVIYKDADVLAINKPPGIAVQGGSGQGGRHIDAMLDALRFDSPERPRLVHRLDKDTSGVLLLARSAKAASELAARFARKDIEKVYMALVKGVPKPRQGEIDLPLAKLALGKDSREQVAVERTGGQRALTEYRVTEAFAQKLAWVELKPITGRTHQLRVHMAAIGHPIIGDGKYGGREAFVEGLPERLHLHARRITLPRWRGKTLVVEAKLPAHMEESRSLL